MFAAAKDNKPAGTDSGGPTLSDTMDSPKSGKLNLLLLCDYKKGSASTIIDHIYGIKQYSQHSVYVLSSRGEFPKALDLSRFDGLIIHYSLIACLDSFIGPKSRAAIRQFRGLKIIFIQDDYRFIDATVSASRDLGINILFGLAPDDIIDEVYSPTHLPNVIRETVLAGYVPEHLTTKPVPAYADRKIDVGYRARKVPTWLGTFGQQKWIIADRFSRDAGKYDLTCDISTREDDRLYGRHWIEFITSCKATIGSESGAGVCDFTGQIQRNVEAHESAEPTVSFEVLRDLYFKDEDGRLPMNVISPRCFEAAALRTLMILYEGRYSNRLVGWRHYVPLKLDHSNMDEVVAVLRDPVRAQSIIDAAFHEVALNPENMFASMVRQMDRAIERGFQSCMAASSPRYSPVSFLKVRFSAHMRATKGEILTWFYDTVAPGITSLANSLPDAVSRRIWPLIYRIRDLLIKNGL